MSKVKTQSDLSGVFGERVLFRKVRGKVEAQNNAKRKRSDPTEKQLAAQANFITASQYAKIQSDDKDRSVMYATRVTPKLRSAYLVALNDFMNPPTMLGIAVEDYHGAIGDKVKIKAIDDFMVKRVIVTISDDAGNIIEQGDGSQTPLTPDTWEYIASAANPSLKGTKITATAFDYPDHKASLEVVLL